ncbi:MAG: serine/threonine-protein kinase [Sorangiineae bacterium]|nr:serine/threonine-protein kinase [Polyangiaceae bacterium]MEB2324519.1 serine/threonine-protein kinase [Sorangiineae bacterium]
MEVVCPLEDRRLGPYELGERLGAGGMAEVFVARRAGPRGFAKRLAVKRILPDLARDERLVAMFCDEARICAALSHPNIVQVVDFGEADGVLFMAMEYVDGISCAKLLRAVAARGERFPLGVALYVAHEVLRALEYAHEARDSSGRALGIVHRDVSPGNVLLGRAGEVKLTDFGIVKSALVDRRTYPGELKGKLGYMSPEQVMGAEVDARSDLFAVGIVLAEMLIARPLFPGKNELEILTRIHEADLRMLSVHGAGLPRRLQSALTRALAREPHDRFASASEFAGALRAAASAEGVGMGDAELIGWLAGLGVLPSQSGVREAITQSLEVDLSELEPPRAPARPAEGGRVVGPARPAAAASCYEVRVERRATMGPMSRAQLLELAATGRLTERALISVDGGGFRPARQLADLARLLARPAFRFGVEPEGELVWRRSLAPLALPALIYELVVRRETGVLRAVSGGREKRVHLTRGELAFVSSTDRGELIGHRLVHAGLVTRQALDDALDRAAASATRVGQALVEQGKLRPLALLRALIEQLEARLLDLFRFHDGEVAFVRGAPVGDERVSSRLSSLELVTRVARAAAHDDELARHLDALGGASVRHAPSPPVAVSELGLPAPERRVLELGGDGPVAALVARFAEERMASPRETRRALFVGLASGLLVAPRRPVPR